MNKILNNKINPNIKQIIGSYLLPINENIKDNVLNKLLMDTENILESLTYDYRFDIRGGICRLNFDKNYKIIHEINVCSSLCSEIVKLSVWNIKEL